MLHTFLCVWSHKEKNMKIILFVNKDFEANLAYNLLKKELTNHNVKIHYSESVGKLISKPKELLQIEILTKNSFTENLKKQLNEME